MWYSLAFALLCAGSFVLALRWGWWGLLPGWWGLNCGVLSLAYALRRPGWLGKLPDGTFAPAALFWLPYRLATRGLSRIRYRFGIAPPACEVLPGLWLGPRPLAREVDPRVQVILDLTAELPLDGPLRGRLEYRCVPTLDGTAPDPAALARILDEDDPSRPMLVHCALGHGRSAVVAAALLLSRGAASDPAEAVARLRALRPGVCLTRDQWAVLEGVWTARSTARSAGPPQSPAA